MKVDTAVAVALMSAAGRAVPGMCVLALAGAWARRSWASVWARGRDSEAVRTKPMLARAVMVDVAPSVEANVGMPQDRTAGLRRRKARRQRRRASWSM